MYLFWVGGCVCVNKNGNKIPFISSVTAECALSCIDNLTRTLEFYLKRMCSCPVVYAARVKKVILSLWIKLKSKISANAHSERRHNSCVPHAAFPTRITYLKMAKNGFQPRAAKKQNAPSSARMYFTGCAAHGSRVHRAACKSCVSCIMLLACHMSLEGLCWSVAPCYVLTRPTAC